MVISDCHLQLKHEREVRQARLNGTESGFQFIEFSAGSLEQVRNLERGFFTSGQTIELAQDAGQGTFGFLGVFRKLAGQLVQRVESLCDSGDQPLIRSCLNTQP